MGWSSRGGVGKARPHGLSSIRSGSGSCKPLLEHRACAGSPLWRVLWRCAAVLLVWRPDVRGCGGACLAPSAADCEGRLQALQWSLLAFHWAGVGRAALVDKAPKGIAEVGSNYSRFILGCLQYFDVGRAGTGVRHSQASSRNDAALLDTATWGLAVLLFSLTGRRTASIAALTEQWVEEAPGLVWACAAVVCQPCEVGWHAHAMGTLDRGLRALRLSLAWYL